MTDINVSVIIPAFNEEKNIKDTINALKEVNAIKQIIVVNDGSKDKTQEIVEKLDVQLINHDKNHGKGCAINTGAKYVTEDVVALVDGDLGTTAKEIKKLFKPIYLKEADISVAILPGTKKKGGFGLVKKLALVGLKLNTKEKFRAPLSGQRVMKRDVLEKLLPFSNGFGIELEMTINSLKNGYRIKEIKTNISHNETGRDIRGFIHRGRQFKDILLSLLTKGLKS